MNDKQRQKKEVLQQEVYARRGIKKSLPDKGESKEGIAFTEVERVTVIIGRGGRFQLPAVRHYDNGLDAAVYADDEWKKQDSHPSTATRFGTGHLSPIVGTDWFCESKSCPCKSESYGQRLKRSLEPH